jgi:pimeloyl-ACP methyl ester carboxylesterase
MAGTSDLFGKRNLPPDATEERRIAIAKAAKELEGIAQQGLKLKRPVFFVPGWTGEDSSTWLKPNTSRNIAPKIWIDRIFRNAADYVTYVDFVEESPRCHSFFDFGSVVTKKIGKRRPCDCVGHSMGGLDIAAAIALCEPPLLDVRRFVTFGSPLRGTELGGLRAKLRGMAHILEQAKSMDPDQRFIKELRSPESLKRLLARTENLYSLYGSQDMAVRKSGRFDYRDIDPSWKGADPDAFKAKVRVIDIQGAEHTGLLGITQDPRAILWLVRILGDLPFPETPLNHGYLLRR